jgi:hypothetical protein
MAKKASSKKSGSTKSKKGSVRKASGTRSRSSSSKSQAGEAFVSLLQSPLVADLVAVAATSALAALAEQGFSRQGAEGGGKRAGKAVRQAGKAAAAAVGRRLSEEIDAIKQASKAAQDGKAAKA